MQRNPMRGGQAEMRRQAALALPAAVPTVPGGAEAGGVQVGGNDPVTHAWRPAGISNVTSTADGFYSAAG